MHTFSTDLSTVLQFAAVAAAAVLVIVWAVVGLLVWTVARELQKSALMAGRQSSPASSPELSHAELEQRDRFGHPADDRCPRCGNAGSHSEGGVEYCSTCGAPRISASVSPQDRLSSAQAYQADRAGLRAEPDPCALCARIRRALGRPLRVVAATARGRPSGRGDSAPN